MNNFSYVLLSDRPDLKQRCCQLLGEEWKRSDTARLQGLSPNSKDLPDSLLLLDESEGAVEVIGHSRLSRVLEDKHGCWIASVIISKERRGQGLGKHLMMKTEEYAKVLGFTTAYLNTRDKQGFYEYLGYTYCSPVSTHKGGSFSMNGMGDFRSFYCQILGIHKGGEIKCSASQLEDAKTSGSADTSSNIITSSIAPPPPPPLASLNTKAGCFTSATGHYWMKKYL